MARWRLVAPHYLYTDPPTIWEQVETDRDTGAQARHTYTVPRHLDPNNPKDYNTPDGIVVTNKRSREYPRDIVFLGDPTPDMDPIDDEAQAISDSFKSKWIHPIETLPSNGDFGNQIISALERQMSDILKGKPTSSSGVDPAAFAALQEQVASLMAANAALTDRLESKPEPSIARRA